MLNILNHLNRATVTLILLAMCTASLGVPGAVVYDVWHAQTSPSTAGAGIVSRAIDSAAVSVHALLMLHPLPVICLLSAVALVTVFLLWLEIRNVVAQPQLILSRGQLGQVAISLKQVGMLAQHAAELIAGVREVHTVTQARKSGLDVQQTISVEPEHPLPALAAQIQERVKQSLEFHLGFPVAAVRVQLQQASLSKALL